MKEYALITGASRGIGKAIALKLAQCGYNLIITASKDALGLKETAAEAAKTGVSILACFCDVSSSERVNVLADDLEEIPAKENGKNQFYGNSFGLTETVYDNISVIVNNAGIDSFELVQNITDVSWDKTIGTNLNGVFYTTRAFLSPMLSRHSGCILNISSYWGIHGSAMESAYCASKGGVNAFTLSLARELEPSGIRVNALACEYIDTDMNKGFSEEEIQDVLKTMPSHRVISPEEVAEMAAALINPDCSITGRILSMDEAAALIRR